MTTLELQRRWYRFTPDRLLLGLLAVEAFLLLSERCKWFAFNEHKGWTVLIAVASVGVAMLLMLFWFAASLLFRRQFQFGVRLLLVLVVAIAIPCSWLTMEIQQTRKQREAVEAIVKLGGWVYYDYQWDVSDRWIENAEPPEPIWLRELFGDDLFSAVACVDLFGNQVTDAGLEHLKGLTELRYLHLDTTRVTDAGPEHIKGLTQLRHLVLHHTQVTDAGLGHLKAMTQLTVLQLGYTQVTDAGLEHLEGLTQLQWLNLLETQVTDAGLEHVKGFCHLQLLILSNTKVTDRGVKKLHQVMPNCQIVR